MKGGDNMPKTGDIVQTSGIYRCTNPKCDKKTNEITFVKGKKVPPCPGCGHTNFTLVRETK